MGKKWALYLMLIVLVTLGVGCGVMGAWPFNSTETMGTPQVEQYDLIVIGGDPEGVVAAVAAARSGLKTLLIEKRDGLGGVLTYGQLNFLDLAYYQDTNINQGLFTEWHNKVGGGNVFEPEQAKQAFLQMVRGEPNITLLLQTKVVAPVMAPDNKQIIGVQTLSAQGVQTYSAKRFIDATEDADLAAMAGVPYFVGQEDIGIKSEMAVTLMIHLKNVDWAGVKRAIDMNKFGGGRIGDDYAWGFPELKDAYKPREAGTRLRGLNIGRTKDGTVWINALQILGVEGLNQQAKDAAYAKGKRETEVVLTFLRRELPGFERAEIASIPPELYVRETRHIIAEYQLPLLDLWENKDHWDRIGFGGYPVDMQATTAKRGDVIVADPELYALPFRSYVPLRVEGLLVTSRAAGYSSLAAGSSRTVPTGMTAGEAAGIAAGISIKQGVQFREMSKSQDLIAELQRTIRERGGYVEPVQLKHPYQGESYYASSIQPLINHGLLTGGYGNDLGAERPMTEEEFVEMLHRTLRLQGEQQAHEAQKLLKGIGASSKPLTRDKMLQYYLAVFGKQAGPNVWHQAKAEQLVDVPMELTLTHNRVVLRHEGFRLISKLVHVKPQKPLRQ